MTIPITLAAQRRARVMRWGALATCVGASVVLGAIANWRAHHLVLINRTESLPTWAFLVREGELPRRGDYFTFLPPRGALIERHFGRGPEPWNKIALGIAGDLIEHRGAMVMINRRIVGRMKPRTRFGEPLTPGPTGRVPEGCFYAGTSHPDGFDSRYAEIGFICRAQVIGVSEPIL